jgi:hypothetical protein
MNSRYFHCESYRPFGCYVHVILIEINISSMILRNCIQVYTLYDFIVDFICLNQLKYNW